jgi:carbamoyltransferase
MAGIIGINAYHADASAAFVAHGKLIAAAEEERFNRIKHSAGFPAAALRYVVEASGAQARDITALAVPRDPWARLVRKAWHGLRMPASAANRLKAQTTFASIGETVADTIGCARRQIEVHRVEHHLAHLASAFFVSPFDEAALLSIDGLGDFASTM